jgi:protein-S-isoprenylcysteine O-methyltransferase Ste14
LILLNLDHWFIEPLSVFQIISWVLLLSSCVLAVYGFYLLKVIGKPKGEIENTTVLVKAGAFKYIRHPIYSTFLLGEMGVFFKNPSFINGALIVVISSFVIATAKVEEAENLQKFGSDYAEYMKTTKMFIPYLF